MTVPSKCAVTCQSRLHLWRRRTLRGKKYGKCIKMCILFKFSSLNIKNLKLFISQTGSWFIINENGNIMRQDSLSLPSTSAAALIRSCLSFFLYTLHVDVIATDFCITKHKSLQSLFLRQNCQKCIGNLKDIFPTLVFSFKHTLILGEQEGSSLIQHKVSVSV